MQAETSSASLSPGTLIGRYEIREVLGIGGFGITYKANDSKLKRLVAIKEYLPAETAVRAHNSSIVNAYDSRTDEYQYGLERFLDEAKTLAKFHHPNIIGVLDHLELNNTAYLIMTYEQGQTLSQLLKQQSQLPEQELKAIVKAILTGLQHIHEQDYYHRDIKPGNIYLRKQGEPVLIDFGAARQAIGARSRSLTNIVSAGYAPSEQYGSNESKQGPWSDLYAVGATLYKSISGQVPIDAPTRQNALFEQDPDPLTPASKIAKGHYTEQLLQLIDWMLAPAIKNRPQNVTQVIARLEQAQPIQEANSTAATVINQEARSTIVTEVIKQQDTQHPHQQNRDQQTKQATTENSNGAKKVIVIATLLIFAIGLSQIPALQQLITDSNPTDNTAAYPQTSQQVAQTQEQHIQARVQQAEAAEQHRKQQQTIQTLLKQAETDIQQMRLSRPQGNNAVEKYQQILQLQADHQAAQQGLTRVAEKYLAMAAAAQQQKNYQKARQLLNKANIIQPDNSKITQAERQLDSAEASYQQEQSRIAAQKIKIGSTGPGGGIVFYVDSFGKHGLEAKRADEGGGELYKWGFAMRVAKSSGSGWHLPSKRELNLLYQQKDVVGGFADYGYWSSTESGSAEAWSQYFSIGNQFDNLKYVRNRVRAVRAF